MKPGDLIRLTLPYEENGIIFVYEIPSQQRHGFVPGTLAIFLNTWHGSPLSLAGEKKMQILVNNMVCWVYESECREAND